MPIKLENSNVQTEQNEASVEEPSYLSYWSDIAQHYPELAEIATQNAAKVESLRQKVLIDLEAPKGGNLAKGVEEWYMSLGSFNQLQGGQADLLIAAGILQEDIEQNGKSIDFIKNPDGKKERYYKKNTLLAGCLIHEAARLEKDPEKKQRLLKSAYLMYGRLYKDGGLSWDDESKINASRYRHDIEMEAASRPQEMILARINQLEDFFKISQHDNPNGLVYEEAVIIAVGREYYELGIDEEISIRHAMPREDQPHDTLSLPSQYGQYPKHSFDAMIEEQDESGEARRVPLQFKSFDSDEKYIPEILIVEPPNDIGALRDALNMSMRRILKAYKQELAGSSTQYINDDVFSGLNASVAEGMERLKAA